MHINSVFRLALVGSIFCSCQSDSFRINGQSDLLAEGDTICLINEDNPNKVLCTTVSNNEKFLMTGTIPESPTLCRIYVKKDPAYSAELFLESGDITVELAQPPKQSRVSGTRLNNEWQKLNDSIKFLGKELIHISKIAKDADQTTHNLHLKKIDSLHRRMSECILNTAQRNSNNMLGKYIQKNYKEPKFK